MSFFEQKHQEIEQHLHRCSRYFLLDLHFHCSFSLKSHLIELVVKIEQDIKDEELLRQKIRANLTIMQRLKGQLMELRLTIDGKGEMKLKVRRDETRRVDHHRIHSFRSSRKSTMKFDHSMKHSMNIGETKKIFPMI